MSQVHLLLRTPSGLLLDREVQAVVAEDRSGWFGVRPGCADLVAVLPPGLLTFRDEEGEGFVALSGGLLDLRGADCRVVARDAVLSRRLEDVAAALEAHLDKRRRGQERQRGVLHDLVREALRRLAKAERP